MFGICGGCALQHLSPSAQVRHKHAVLTRDLRRIAGLADANVVAPVTGPVWHYRRKARLGVKFVHRKGRVLVGFRERRKPYITDMERCPVLVDKLETLPARLAALIGGLSLASAIPQVEVAVGDNRTALVFRVLEQPDDADLQHFARFEAEHDVDVWLQSGGLDTVTPLRGTGTAALLEYRLSDWDLCMQFFPTDFVQVNRSQNENLLRRAIGWLQPGPDDRVLDLFSGIGNFSLPIARTAGNVFGVEGAATLVDRARSNAAANGLQNVEFGVADLDRLTGTEPWLKQRWNKALIDPARAGAEALLPHLAGLTPETIVYVSCNPGTLARDIRVLVGDYGYRLESAGIVDMFPHTAHIESVARLVRTA